MGVGESRLSVARGDVAPAPPGVGTHPLAWFESWRERRPAAPAIEVGARQWTYAELDELAGRIAGALAGRMRPGHVVAVCLDRSPLLAALAVALARLDAAYLNLGPGPGRERLRMALEATGAPCVLTGGAVEPPPGWTASATGVPGLTLLAPRPAPPPMKGGGGAFYVVLTSGSTGRPKAVTVGRDSFANLVAWHCAAGGQGPGGRPGMLVGVTFDAHPLELWAGLGSGACLCVGPDEARTSPAALLAWMGERRITALNLPTPLAELAFDLPWPADLALESLVTGGDRLRRWPPPLGRARVYNAYGPAETTCTATAQRLDTVATEARGAVPIGRPISGVEVRVVDAAGRPVPVGDPGELWVTGAALALGYLDPGQTAERFVPAPDGARAYRTGDRARMRPDGVLEFLGRLDDQVKVRGVRVEPGEVERALERSPGVRQAAVVAVPGPAGDRRLVAFVRPRSPGSVRPAALLQTARERLPAQAVPSFVHVVDDFPLTPNTKIDRAALAAIAAAGEPLPAGRRRRSGAGPTHVLGFSGLHHSVPFKRRELPGLPERSYRLTQGFDSAAALVNDEGVVAAAAEERFTGEKATGRFPARAMRSCLDRAGIALDDVDAVAHSFHYRRSAVHERDDFTRRRFEQVYAPEVQLACLQETFGDAGVADRFVPVPHHLAHAASALLLSGFEESLVLVVDGMGERESASVLTGVRGDLELLRTVPALHSLGVLYGLFTHHLGFTAGTDEYKVMGLAAAGNPRRFFPVLESLIQLRDGGTFVVPVLARDTSVREEETHEGVLAELARVLGPAREPGGPLERRHADVAAALQAGLEGALLHLLRHFRAETGLRRLCLAGGVALNCTANGKVHRSRLFDRIFVQPAAGDDGSALGAALLVHRRSTGRTPGRMTMPYWGPEYSDAEIEAALGSRPDCLVTPYRDARALTAEVARLLAAGRVCAWFQGRMEFGPRALGCRSILADPRDARMRDHLNEVIKEREGFRPFAPVVTAEQAAGWFVIPPGEEDLFAHMLVVAPVRPERRALLGAVTHVDGSARVQAIRREDNPLYWQVVSDFGAITGVPVLLNTSFNLRGQPIVCSPEEALDTFLRSRLDALVIGRNLVLRAPVAAPGAHR